ncbi:hypothetical protein AJ80_07024 [Polytolypa hystricis UAMH7299]|uniref:Peptidase S54 rhomboid domain-containing protein n=1 Tax=Polytolypa hystricis (strain UAMH7299) TaxID=1447883 RepID=A0A2B7XT40_POLH7|nr:hypothetical protein AJ80_07024 [Polytolypa hystricis UAMH7299]
MLSSGFTNAPLTKYALIFIIAGSIAASITDVKYMFYIQVVPHLWGYWQFWRVVVWQACYTNSGEVLFASMLLYQMRVIERLWGTRKFASFILTTLPYTTLLAPLLLALLLRPLSLNTMNYLPAGPTSILFAILAQYHAAIPQTFKYRISTSTSSDPPPPPPPPSSSSSPSSPPTTQSHLSDKSTTYLVAAQLALAQFPASLIPALSGWIIGHAWRAELLPGRSAIHWRVPGWVYGDSTADARRGSSSRRGRDGRQGSSADDESGAGAGAGASGSRDAESYEGLRRRLEGESRAAAVTAGGRGGGVEEVGVGGQAGREAQVRRPLAGQILDRFRGAF